MDSNSGLTAKSAVKQYPILIIEAVLTLQDTINIEKIEQDGKTSCIITSSNEFYQLLNDLQKTFNISPVQLEDDLLHTIDTIGNKHNIVDLCKEIILFYRLKQYLTIH